MKQHAEAFGIVQTLVPEMVISKISKAKAKGHTPHDMRKQARTNPPSEENIAKVIAQVYEEYQDALRKSNSLDFDDLLMKGVQLFRDNPEVARWCKHIVVDEL